MTRRRRRERLGARKHSTRHGAEHSRERHLRATRAKRTRRARTSRAHTDVMVRVRARKDERRRRRRARRRRARAAHGRQHARAKAKLLAQRRAHVITHHHQPTPLSRSPPLSLASLSRLSRVPLAYPTRRLPSRRRARHHHPSRARARRPHRRSQTPRPRVHARPTDHSRDDVRARARHRGRDASLFDDARIVPIVRRSRHREQTRDVTRADDDAPRARAREHPARRRAMRDVTHSS